MNLGNHFKNVCKFQILTIILNMQKEFRSLNRKIEYFFVPLASK